jgi:hypothetical protein
MNNDSAFTASGQSVPGQSAHTEGGFTSPSHEQASQLEKSEHSSMKYTGGGG